MCLCPYVSVCLCDDLCVCVCAHTFVLWGIRSCKDKFVSAGFTTWLLGFKFRLSDLEAVPLPIWPSFFLCLLVCLDRV